MNISPSCLDEHKQKPVFTTPSTRYHRPLLQAEKERLDPILEKKITIFFLSDKGSVSRSSYSLKHLQDYFIQKMSVWSSEAEIFLIGSVASSILQKAHGCKDIDVRVMLPHAIVDTAKSDLLVTHFLQSYAPKTTTGSWRPMFNVYTAPDLTSRTYQMSGLDLNFRSSARTPVFFCVNKSDGFAIRLSDRHVFCIDQQTYCSTEASFEEGYRQLVQKLYPIFHFQHLHGIEFRVLKKATFGYCIQETAYFKVFSTRIKADYYLTDDSGKTVKGWLGKKEWLTSYKNHLQVDYPACIQGNERIQVYLLDILNLLACMNEESEIFSKKLASIWNSRLPGIRDSFNSPLYFLERYPEDTHTFLQLVQALVCCHHTYCMQEGRALLKSYSNSYSLLLRRGETLFTMHDLKEKFHDSFDKIVSLAQHDARLLASLQSLFSALDLPDIAWTAVSKTRYSLLLSWQADPLIQNQSPHGISLLKEAFLHPKSVVHWSKEKYGSLLHLFQLPWMQPFLPTAVTLVEIARTLDIPLLAEPHPKMIKHPKKRSPIPPPSTRLKGLLDRIRILFKSLENLHFPLHTVSEEIRTITNKAQKNRWIYQKQQNTLLKKLVPFHLQARHHEEVESFRELTHLLQERLQVYAQRTHQKEYFYWQSLYTAVARQCIISQIKSLPFLQAPKRRLFYILATPIPAQRALCIALQTHVPHSVEESQALLQTCMKAPYAFLSLKAQEDLLDLRDFIIDRYPIHSSHEELYKIFSQLITLFLRQRHRSLQDLGYQLFCSLPHPSHLSSRSLKKAWTKHSKMLFSFLVKMGEYGQLSKTIPPIYSQLNDSHCDELTLHLQNLAISFHLQLFSQLAETPLSEDKYPNGTIPFLDTQPWSLTSTDLHRLILQLNNGIILYEKHPTLFRNAVDLIARLMTRTPDHSFDLIHDGYTTLDKLYHLQKNARCPAEEMSWYPQYSFSFAIHLHQLTAVRKDLLPLERLIPRLAAIVPLCAKEVGQGDLEALIKSCLSFLHDFALLSLIQKDPNMFISFLDRTIKPLLEQLRTSQFHSKFFFYMSNLMGEFCIQLGVLHSTITSIPYMFSPNTKKKPSSYFSSLNRPNLTILKKKLRSDLAFSIIKNKILGLSTDLISIDMLINNAIRFHLHSKQYSDISATYMKILVYLHRTIFVLFNRVAQKEELPAFCQLWNEVYDILMHEVIKGNHALLQELQKTASQCPRLAPPPPSGSQRVSILDAMAKSHKVKHAVL